MTIDRDKLRAHITRYQDEVASVRAKKQHLREWLTENDMVGLECRQTAEAEGLNAHERACLSEIASHMPALLDAEQAATERAERAEALLSDVAVSIRQHRTDTMHGGVDDEALWAEADRIAAHLAHGKTKQ